MIEPPATLLQSKSFARYFDVWRANETSIVFVPLAEISRTQGFVKEAREICERGLHHYPASVSGRIVLARIYRDLGERENLLKLLETILQDFPSHQEARRLMLEAGKGEGGQHPVWETCTMAQILSDQGERSQALRILTQILTRDPANERARRLKEVL